MKIVVPGYFILAGMRNVKYSECGTEHLLRQKKGISMDRTESTIAAVSTAPGKAGIGIVRVSGPDAFEIADRVFHPKNKDKKISSSKSHTIHYGWIYDGNEPVDEVLVMVMKRPYTYTGEDTVEIDCHGGIYATRKVLETVLSAGASIAGPGEFTKRAFLNGRIDLSQAEAVMDIIEAKNEYSHRSSLEHLKGRLYQKTEEIRKKILYEIAYIEAALDDPEHISLDGHYEELTKTVEEITREITALLSRSQNGKIIKEGIKTVIVGKPNAGKSSLMNVMTGEEKAIVTEIAGTTRDMLDEYINLNGISLHLIDTAGIRNTEDIIEKIGVERSLQALEEADLIIYVMDSSAPIDENDKKILSLLKEKKVIILYNKTDLPSSFTLDDLSDITDLEAIPVSMKEETGIGTLEEKIKEMFFEGEIVVNDELYVTNLRQIGALRDALDSLNLAMEGIENQMPEDLISIDLTDACDHLGKITGASVQEDIVNEIFNRFCMGK